MKSDSPGLPRYARNDGYKGPGLPRCARNDSLNSVIARSVSDAAIHEVRQPWIAALRSQ